MNVVFPNRSPLSVKELNHVLDFMEPLDQVSFSLISKATKSIIVSRNLFAGSIHLFVDDAFKISMYTPDGKIILGLSQKNEDWNGGDPVKLIAADIVEVDHETEEESQTYQWRKEGFGIKNWINHIMKINHSQSIHHIYFYEGGERIDIDSVVNAIGGLTVNYLCTMPGCSERYRHLVDQKVHVENLNIFSNTFQGNEEIRKHLIQNYSQIVDVSFSSITFRLDDFLMMNCEELFTAGIPLKTANQFLKIWRTGCKIRLKKLRIGFPSTMILDKDVILKGIAHIELEDNAYKINGANGSLATVFIDPEQSVVEFVVSEG
ncbi:hypothetical protein CAEBREN_21118 [Caenorhabditis brenneri]|uniref:Uncharacterized protein n=1 Tax=Caenorhabditis brenneri TaxID=135651 RepID=G0P7U3_CAEBE|nr:hypothetical protein CAEBREN_21118 [Caenorhabditis brenneri]